MRLPHRLLCLSAVSFTGWRLQQQKQQQKHHIAVASSHMFHVSITQQQQQLCQHACVGVLPTSHVNHWPAT
jgi:hypothetical protein